MVPSAGKLFRTAVSNGNPLQVVGVINAYTALMAQKVGYKALYLSGAGVANSSFGLPDLALTTLTDVLEDARRITAAVDLPLLVDIDTGWGSALMIKRTVKAMIKAGVGAVHIEDQVAQKRCGHLPGKSIVSKNEMVDRINAAIDAKTDDNFVVMARTDALAIEGLDSMLERLVAYRDAGADMVFPEALQTLEQYEKCRRTVGIPILANQTEFGVTPLFELEELRKARVDIVLYPLSANRAMNLAALKIYSEIMERGTQQQVVDQMQTREELYHYLDYDTYT